jgi:predicted RNA-binding protein with PUA-like domain
MNYFLAKTEPGTYSIADLEKEKTTTWSGVRNPQAVNALKAMKKGDRVLIYHSQGEGAIRGLAEVLGNGRPDLKDEKSWLVDFKFIRKFAEPYVTLKEIKESKLFADFKLVYQSRLSTMEAPQEFIGWLKKKGLKA